MDSMVDCQGHDDDGVGVLLAWRCDGEVPMPKSSKLTKKRNEQHHLRDDDACAVLVYDAENASEKKFRLSAVHKARRGCTVS